LLGVFALGAVAGAGGAFAYTRHEVEEFASQPGARMQGRIRGLARALDLTDAQRDQIKAIFDRHRSESRRPRRTARFARCSIPISRRSSTRSLRNKTSDSFAPGTAPRLPETLKNERVVIASCAS
jgi:hypothetical protein